MTGARVQRGDAGYEASTAESTTQPRTLSLRDAWRSLAEAEGDEPGHDYDRGYLTGWYDVRRGIRRRQPRFGFRSAESVDEARKGYRHGREDGKGRETDWWPDFALGQIDESVFPPQAIPGSGEPVRQALIQRRNAARYERKVAQEQRKAAEPNTDTEGAA